MLPNRTRTGPSDCANAFFQVIQNKSPVHTPCESGFFVPTSRAFRTNCFTLACALPLPRMAFPAHIMAFPPRHIDVLIAIDPSLVEGSLFGPVK